MHHLSPVGRGMSSSTPIRERTSRRRGNLVRTSHRAPRASREPGTATRRALLATSTPTTTRAEPRPRRGPRRRRRSPAARVRTPTATGNTIARLRTYRPSRAKNRARRTTSTNRRARRRSGRGRSIPICRTGSGRPTSRSPFPTQTQRKAYLGSVTSATRRRRPRASSRCSAGPNRTYASISLAATSDSLARTRGSRRPRPRRLRHRRAPSWRRC